LSRKNYKWSKREIYKYLKQHLRYLRRRKRNLEKLIANKVNQGDKMNEVEGDRELFVMEIVQNMETPKTSIQRRGDVQEFDVQPL